MQFIRTLSAVVSLITLAFGASPVGPIANRYVCSLEPAGVRLSGYTSDATSAEGFNGAVSFADAADGAVSPDE